MSIYSKAIITHETLVSANSVSFTRFHVLKPNRRRNNGELVLPMRCDDVVKGNCLSSRNRVRVHFSNGWNSGIDTENTNFTRKRNVVDHICLLKAKGDLSDEEEKDMLDYLYTLQYQMGGIVAISLGCNSDHNPDGYSHAIYMRFQRKEDLVRFYKSSSYSSVLKDHVMPYCHELISVDYEAQVEDDILPIFRKGEEFNYGVEFMLLISFAENALAGCVEDALAALAKLTKRFPSLIVQATQGSNLNLRSSQYTHAAVIRFRSSDAFEMFIGSPDYKDMWNKKFEPITQHSLAIHFPIEPVGTEIM
ncbi:hypothetical protein AQUCO_04900028v1 [Aquilegia coerulea]|uniref:Stress-response A/B barrel domain-containing protein n=1 Tax=Aquilegia coerulea TaxID=218851 RepID=A0A2G5CJG2_AQUCA|nr:hypothetical protein AQUCO_04900028v1 [Aquilegia coerulea]PIA31444.1 hypothetical protein AQUCO_04900028v1 [Aquilegia coerulea]